MCLCLCLCLCLCGCLCVCPPVVGNRQSGSVPLTPNRQQLNGSELPMRLLHRCVLSAWLVRGLSECAVGVYFVCRVCLVCGWSECAVGVWFVCRVCLVWLV